ncbi:MAG: recombinase family protein [Desulfobacteraceae bacterium]|nr:recombinase family protein [Desulfobacteraceae bacterium]MBC2750102.1 recombinase family protein [Desulfobacteraceae bacterium]
MNYMDRISEKHLNRKAVIYIRQSTDLQVKVNTASPIYQREQREHAIKYGWDSSRIEIIEDQGQSGSLIGNREGFQRIIEQIGQNQIGAIFYHDLSRISRNTKVFHDLLYLCKLFEVLFFEDGRLMDPNDSADAFMVGIRAEVAQFENRDRVKKMRDGVRARIKSGCSVSTPPIGYVCSEKGKWIKHPDENVRGTIELIFKLAKELSSIYGIYQHFEEKGIQVPKRSTRGVFDHSIQWIPPTYQYMKRLLDNQNYTSDYHYGRTMIDRRLGALESNFSSDNAKVRKSDPSDILIIPDHHEGYVSRKMHAELKHKFSLNAFMLAQPPLAGDNLLQGIIICGHCGRRMSNKYQDGAKDKRYYTTSGPLRKCPAGARMIDAIQVDDAVLAEIFKVIAKPNVDEAIHRYEADRCGAADQRQLLKLKLRQAEAQVRESEKDYLAVDPENHMVRKTLEDRWQEQLVSLEALRTETHQPIPKPAPLTKQQREQLTYLCRHFEEAFHSDAIDNPTRKRLIRCFMDKVVLSLKDDLIVLELHWKDRSDTISILTLQTKAYVYRYILVQYHKGLDEQGILEAMKRDKVEIPGRVFTRLNIARYIKEHGLPSCTARKRKHVTDNVMRLHEQGLSYLEIAERLNAGGVCTVTGGAFSEVNVIKILGTMLRQQGRTSQKKGAANWPVIRELYDRGFTTHEMVVELKTRGLKTGTGMDYTYKNLRKIIRRQGLLTPKANIGLPRELKARLEAFHKAGLSFRQAWENLIDEGVAPHDTLFRKRVCDNYRRMGAKGARPENIPMDFQREIHDLVERGLSTKQIAKELNRLGLKTVKGKPYNRNSVGQYCRGIGLPLNKRRYLDDPRFKREVDILLSAGKSCRQIADHLNIKGFKTFMGRLFKDEDIRSLLERQALKAPKHCKYDYIIEAIAPLNKAGYHPRTIASKLNTQGIKTVTGQRFSTRTVKHYLRKLKALEEKGTGREVA